LVQIKPGGKTSNMLTSTDQYYFQSGRDFQVSARVNF
jgi:hypothetical protein